MAAARAYLDLLAGKDAQASFAANCSALENGAHRDGCQPVAAAEVPLADPEFTVDETKGAVAIRGRLGRLRGPDGPTDGYVLRIEGGQIRYVHTMTAK
jgi:hypothetical protein